MAHLAKPVFVILVCLQAFYASSARGNNSCFQEGKVKAVNTGDCSKWYHVCVNKVWVKAMCVGGKINTTLHQCQPSGQNCPKEEFYPVVPSRKKRRTTLGSDCSHSYRCPTTVKEMFIYPDWSNPNCDTFIMCRNGQSVLSSCKQFGLNFYNPRRLSCEDVATATNTCMFRLKTDLSPIQ